MQRETGLLLFAFDGYRSYMRLLCCYPDCLRVARISLVTQNKGANMRKRSISSIIVRSRAFQHRIGVEQIPENRECQMERKGIRLTGNLIWSRSPAKGSAPRLTPNVRVLPSPACIIGAGV